MGTTLVLSHPAPQLAGLVGTRSLCAFTYDSLRSRLSIGVFLHLIPFLLILLLVDPCLHFADDAAVVLDDRQPVRLVQVRLPSVRKTLLEEKSCDIIGASSKHGDEVGSTTGGYSISCASWND
ncbi:hypothetical protein NMY22_g7152 [Coprinellus aureogranulatus]|nr:hypothetical protein NMY22_g7152 [Coprinellus aureogranulatus]